MWKKIFRRNSSLLYRKKFKCPECGGYSLYIIHDKACECENGCDTDDLNIQEIIDADKFSGYYSSKEIEESFYIDDEALNKIFKSVTIDNTLHLLTANEKLKIQTFLETTSKLDDRLDDVVIDYMNINGLREMPDLNPFGYIINLIEDIHFYTNLCCKDVVLFNFGIEFASKHFYSGRFFYNNAVEHLFQANERIYVILGILYGYHFDSELATNKTFKIEKFLKKNDIYKNSQFKSTFERLKSNNFYNELKEIRDSNTHDVSYFTKIIKDDVEANGDNRTEFWNRDGNEVDKDIYLPKIKNIIFCLNEFYSLIDQILIHLKSNTSIYNIPEFPMYNKYLNFDDSIVFDKYGPSDFEELNKFNIELFSVLPIRKDQRIGDVFFRMGEVIHCIGDIYNISANLFYSAWRYQGLELTGLIDEQYLLYSALLRVYSCYDKLTRYIAQIDSKYSSVDYFEKFSKVEGNGILLNRVREILNSENYKLLFQLRNDIYHNLRAGCLYGKPGLDYYNMVVFKVVFENTKLIYNLVGFINKIDELTAKKVGRNDSCPCGSGIKYKKCCGTIGVISL